MFIFRAQPTPNHISHSAIPFPTSLHNRHNRLLHLVRDNRDLRCGLMESNLNACAATVGEVVGISDWSGRLQALNLIEPLDETDDRIRRLGECKLFYRGITSVWLT